MAIVHADLGPHVTLICWDRETRQDGQKELLYRRANREGHLICMDKARKSWSLILRLILTYMISQPYRLRDLYRGFDAP